MNLNEILKPEFQPLIVAVIFWAWFFILAPARSFKAGIEQEDPPLFFKMSGFKMLRLLGLVAFGGGAFALRDELGRLHFDSIVGGLSPDKLTGLAAAIGLTVVILWVFPEMTARGRIGRNESPGEWKTPMLVLYRWVWLGLTLMLSLGLAESLDLSFDLILGIVLPLVGGLIYLLWWGLPSMFVAHRAEGDDPYALASLSRVRWIGLPAWLRYSIQGRGHGGGAVSNEPQKLCPTCMRSISNVENYESLHFDACPHCGEIVPPAFAIEDYIRRYGTRVREISQARAGGKGRKASNQESDIIQRILRATLTMAVRERATDLHLINESESCLVRGRVDGVLLTMLDLPEEVLRPLISAIKVMSNLNITERRKPQDGSFKTTVDEKKVDIRVNTSPTSTGEAASLRLLYRQEVLGSIEKLGLCRRNHRILNEHITRPHGMILVTGPTGSGKSTTLYNALQTIADGRRNIITLEDPIEFKLDGMTQMQVEPAKNFTFTSGLRSILRQDPDVIMIGEIRDGETAKMAIDAAMTGHLVFSTLHTIDTSTTLSRLVDLGVDPHRHADALLVIAAQRLVRLICELCKEEFEMASDQLAAMGLPGGPEKLILKRGRGCPRCHETGYIEREAIFEILVPDDKIRQMISAKASPAEIRHEARARGMRTLLEDGLTKVILGRTTADEVLRVTS